MKKKFVKVDLESEEFDGDDCYFGMYELNNHLGLEITKSQIDTALYTQANYIDSIVIRGCSAISQVTIFFGTHSHIHLEKEELRSFVEGINKVYKAITFDKYSIKCDKCGFKKTYKSNKRFLYEDKLKDICPKCKNKIYGININL